MGNGGTLVPGSEVVYDGHAGAVYEVAGKPTRYFWQCSCAPAQSEASSDYVLGLGVAKRGLEQHIRGLPEF